MSIKKMDPGILYIVATPIGNLQDLSLRAQSVLSQVHLIAAEDTRHSRHLLNHFGITTPLISLHEHNEHSQSLALLQQLHTGDSIALISDAGTPVISDPGHYLIQKAHLEQIQVVPIPGPCAITSALSAVGFLATRFVFEGFLPVKSSARRQRLTILAQETRTLVFYEAPHRIIECLNDMNQIFGEQRPAALVKELTKRFETVYVANLLDLLHWLTAQAERQKGEFVLVIQGAPPPDKKALNPEAQRILQLLCQELPLNKAAKLTSEITGVKKNVLYDFAIKE